MAFELEFKDDVTKATGKCQTELPLSLFNLDFVKAVEALLAFNAATPLASVSLTYLGAQSYVNVATAKDGRAITVDIQADDPLDPLLKVSTGFFRLTELQRSSNLRQALQILVNKYGLTLFTVNFA